MAPLKDLRIHPAAFPWSRFFCDVERHETDHLEKIGQGIVYSSFEGIIRDLTVLSYYLEHRTAIMKGLAPSAMLIDCHSFPAGLSDVEVCIGKNKGEYIHVVHENSVNF